MSFSKIISYIFFTLIGLFVLLLIISTFPLPGNYKVLIVRSGSMQPAIQTGSLIFSRPADDYAVGDIITYRYGRASITHRIDEKKDDNGQISYITKGDANNSSDKNKITASEIIGRVFLTVPYLGYAVDTVKKPWGFILIVVLPALLIIYDEAIKIFQEIKKIKNHHPDS